MIWGQLIFSAVSFLLTSLLSPKPEVENARASTLDDAQFPQASEGTPLGLALGKVRLKAPNTLWYGDFEAVPIIKKIKTGMFSSKDQIIGYKYYIGFDLGLCLGPNAVLKKIWIEKNLVWEGTAGPNETLIEIDKPSLFGGEDSGGGFISDVRVYGGSFTQPINSYLDGVQAGDTPANVGQCHIVFEKAYIGNTNNLRPVSFEVERYPNGLGLSSELNIIGEDLNPVEILYQVLTLEWGGLNLDPNDIDLTSFTTHAQTLKDEENGISLLVTQANDGKKVINEILRQIDGILYQDPTTGKITLELIRFDYDVQALPTFNEDNITSVRGFSRTSWDSTINQVRVTYTNRENKYEIGAAIVQDLANINTQGRLRSSNVSFPSCYTSDLATKLATRELTQLSVPLFKATLELNREAASLRPGSPFILQWPDYGIQQVVMRVQKFNLGELINGRIVVECIQDQFAVDQTIFASPDASLFVPINRTALEITEYNIQEAPYWLLQQQTEITPTTEANQGYIMAFANSPSSVMLGYSAKNSEDNFDNIITGVDRLLFSSTAELDTAISDTDGFVNSLISSVSINSLSPSSLTLNDAILAEMQSGANLFILNGELFGFLTATDNGGGSFTLNNVYRALLDTVPETHAIDDIIYFLDGIQALVLTDFSTNGTIIKTKLQSFTDIDEYLFSDAAELSLTTNRRYERPLPPDYITLDGNRSLTETASQSTSIAIAWRERNRTSNTIAIESDATETPEATTVYDVLIKSGVTTIASDLDVSGTSTNITLPAGNLGAATIEITAKRNGLNAFSIATFPFEIVA